MSYLLQNDIAENEAAITDVLSNSSQTILCSRVSFIERRDAAQENAIISNSYLKMPLMIFSIHLGNCQRAYFKMSPKVQIALLSVECYRVPLWDLNPWLCVRSKNHSKWTSENLAGYFMTSYLYTNWHDKMHCFLKRNVVRTETWNYNFWSLFSLNIQRFRLCLLW